MGRRPFVTLAAIGRSGANRRSPTLPRARSEGRVDVARPTADKGGRNAQPQGQELAPRRHLFPKDQADCPR
jgi:hypothetical protein